MILPEVWCNDFFTKILSNRRTGRKPKSRVILVNNAASTWDQWAGLLQSTFVYLTPVYIIIVTNGPNPPHYWSDTSPPADLNTDELKVVIVKYVMRSLTKMEGHHPPFQTPVRFLARRPTILATVGRRLLFHGVFVNPVVFLPRVISRSYFVVFCVYAVTMGLCISNVMKLPSLIIIA